MYLLHSSNFTLESWPTEDLLHYATSQVIIDYKTGKSPTAAPTPASLDSLSLLFSSTSLPAPNPCRGGCPGQSFFSFFLFLTLPDAAVCSLFPQSTKVYASWSNHFHGFSAGPSLTGKRQETNFWWFLHCIVTNREKRNGVLKVV